MSWRLRSALWLAEFPFVSKRNPSHHRWKMLKHCETVEEDWRDQNQNWHWNLDRQVVRFLRLVRLSHRPWVIALKVSLMHDYNDYRLQYNTYHPCFAAARDLPWLRNWRNTCDFSHIWIYCHSQSVVCNIHIYHMIMICIDMISIDFIYTLICILSCAVLQWADVQEQVLSISKRTAQQASKASWHVRK